MTLEDSSIKYCPKCKDFKSTNRFYKNKSCNDGLAVYCKDCENKIHKIYRANNKEKIRKSAELWRKNNPNYYKEWLEKSSFDEKQYRKEYRLNNLDKIKQHDIERNSTEERKEYNRNYHKKYYEKHKNKIRSCQNKHRQNRYKTDYMFKLNYCVARAIQHSLKHNKNGKHWESLVNFTLNDLIQHLEPQFTSGMSWDNYGKWHIDHIRPKSSFNFKNYQDNDFKECWKLKNLQPLWAEDNFKKGAKYNAKSPNQGSK